MKPTGASGPPSAENPYTDLGMVSPPFGKKTPLVGRVCALVHLVYPSRRLRIMPEKSRAIRVRDIHELMLIPRGSGSEQPASNLRVLGFVEFLCGSVIVVGDVLILDGKPVGELVGFDGTHAPNHLNIVVEGYADDVADISIDLGSDVKFNCAAETSASRFREDHRATPSSPC